MTHGLKFYLKGGIFILSAYGSLKECEDVIRNWASGHYRLTNTRTLEGRCRLTGMQWALTLDDLVLVNTVTITTEAQPGQQDFGQSNLSGPQFPYPYVQR